MISGFGGGGLFCFVFVFLGLHLKYMQVSRLGVKLELRLPAYTTATAMQDPSPICDLYHSSRQRQILNPLSETKDRTCCSWMLVGFINCGAMTGTPDWCFLGSNAHLSFLLPSLPLQQTYWAPTMYSVGGGGEGKSQNLYPHGESCPGGSRCWSDRIVHVLHCKLVIILRS